MLSDLESNSCSSLSVSFLFLEVIPLLDVKSSLTLAAPTMNVARLKQLSDYLKWSEASARGSSQGTTCGRGGSTKSFHSHCGQSVSLDRGGGHGAPFFSTATSSSSTYTRHSCPFIKNRGILLGGRSKVKSHNVSCSAAAVSSVATSRQRSWWSLPGTDVKLGGDLAVLYHSWACRVISQGLVWSLMGSKAPLFWASLSSSNVSPSIFLWVHTLLVQGVVKLCLYSILMLL